MKIPITQSGEWQKLQNDLKEASFLEENEHFHYLAIKKSTPVGNYLYLPYGPVLEGKSDYKSALKSIEELAEKENCIFIRIEPQIPDLKMPNNAKKSKDLSPKMTN